MDVMYTILTLLPVKSLLRFRCVCKTRRNLIDSPGFIKSHLNRSLESNSNHSFIFTCWSDPSLYQVHDLDTFSSATKITFPGTRIVIIIGTCNGLICACSDNSIVLCNPSMGSFRHIHDPEKVAWKPWKCFGFGYDCLRDDYKIVVLFCGEVVVYSLRDDSWKSLAGNKNIIDSYSGGSQCGLLAHNCLHWIQGGPGDQQVIVFYLHHEEWSKLPPPNETNFLILQSGFFDGYLCLNIATNHTTIRGRVKCDIWCMKEYGVKESWTKLFSFDDLGGMPLVHCNKQSEVIFVRSWIFNWTLSKGKLGQGKTKNVEFVSDLQHNFSQLITMYVDSLTPVTYDHSLLRPREEIDMKNDTSGRRRKLLKPKEEPPNKKTDA